MADEQFSLFFKIGLKLTKQQISNVVQITAVEIKMTPHSQKGVALLKFDSY